MIEKYDIFLPEYLAVLLFFILAVQAYLFIAKKYQIFAGSFASGTETSRAVVGVGVVFPLFVVMLALVDRHSYFNSVELMSIGIVMMMGITDDVRGLSAAFKLVIQIAVAALILSQTSCGDHPLICFCLMPLLIIGNMNVTNFMDGINGMLAIHAIITISAIGYIGWVHHIELTLLASYLIVGLLVFSWLNVRRKAICFAGDSGSLSLGLIIVLMLFQIIQTTDTWIYLGFLLVFWIDTGFTLLQRIARRQNVFQSHREHLYEMLVVSGKLKPVAVSLIYGAAQGLINVYIIMVYAPDSDFSLLGPAAVLSAAVLLYLFIRRGIQSK